MIYWAKETIHEPIFTCKLSKKEIQEISETAFVAPNYPLHTQSTERAVKLVTEASASVCGFDKRDGFIQA